MAPRRSKYNARRTVVDSITFDSKREAARYRELRLLEKTGDIRDLKVQPVYPLEAFTNGRTVGGGEVIGRYVADFAYEQFDLLAGRWKGICEDVKGFKTPLYRWKKKHVEAQYGITITEIR